MSVFVETRTTSAGFALLNRVLSGQCLLKFTKFYVGDGLFDGDISGLTDIINRRIKGRIVGIREGGRFTAVTGMISNQHLDGFMELREIGLWATGILSDGSPIPELGEEGVLFAYTNTDKLSSIIGEYNGKWFHEEEITLMVYTAYATNIMAEIVASSFAVEISFNNVFSGLRASNIQDAIDELSQHITQTVTTAPNGVHGMRVFGNWFQVHVPPFGWLNVAELSMPEDDRDGYGYGEGGYGEGGYGGVDSSAGQFSVIDGVLQHTNPAQMQVIDGVLHFGDNPPSVTDGIIDLTGQEE